MLEYTLTATPTSEERDRAIRTVKQHARDSADEAELITMLGLDHAEPAPPSPRRPRGALSPAQLREVLAPLTSDHGGPG